MRAGGPTLSALGRRAGAQLLRLLPLRVYGRVIPREVIGFCYHLASDRALPHVRHLYPYKSPAHFEADLLFLLRRFRVVSHAELLEARRSGRPLPPGSVYLSFDDALAECFSVVRPLLLKHGVPCTFFLPTAVLDNRWMMAAQRVSLCVEALALRGAGKEDLAELRALGAPVDDAGALGGWLRRAARDPGSPGVAAADRLLARLGVEVDAYLREERPYLTREEARTLRAEGFTLGAHTRTHPHLGSLGDPARVEEEIVESCREVAEMAGEESVPFAFPYDARGVERAFLRELAAAHPVVGTLFGVEQLRPGGGLVVNRMIADTPPAPGRPATNLPGHLRAAYLEEVLAMARGEDGASPLPEPSTV